MGHGICAKRRRSGVASDVLLVGGGLRPRLVERSRLDIMFATSKRNDGLEITAQAFLASPPRFVCRKTRS